MADIIPAIDLIEGKCVRLTQGDFEQKKVYDTDPVAVARRFEEAGIRRLHVVDLDGARARKVTQLKVLEAIAAKTSLKIDFGGGIRSTEDVESVLAAGASQLTAGSIAVKNKELVGEWMDRFGAEKIILGADVKDRMIAISGWQEKGSLELFPFLEHYRQFGSLHVICTDVARDGLLQGPSYALYRDILKRFPDLKLIASGGVASMEDVLKLAAMNVSGIIIGKAIYEQRITLEDLSQLVVKS